jgi:PAS domain S-box-containing protein
MASEVDPMTTDPSGSSPVTNRAKAPKQVFYEQLGRALNEGGFDRNIGALCRPFITSEAGPAWWSSQPHSYFRILFIGYLEGIESEQDLCWLLEDSRSLRDFVGFDPSTLAPVPATLAQIRQPLLPLIHSEAFDSLQRIIEKSGLLEGRVAELDSAMLASDPAIAAMVQRIRSKDHQNYWKRLTKAPGASRSVRPSIPPPNPTRGPTATSADAGSLQAEPFALWVEDLSLAQAAFSELRSAGVTDWKSYFAEHDSHAVDHVIRGCIYGRGPASVRAFQSAVRSDAPRELPQQMAPGSLDACKAITVALAEGRRQCAVEVPLLNAEGQPAVALVEVAVQPGYEESLASVLVSFTDITRRKQAPSVTPPTDGYIERTLSLNQVGVWQWDIATGVTQWSDAMLRIYGISREEFTGHQTDYLEYTYPEDRQTQRESVRQSFADFANQVHSQTQPIDSSSSYRDFRIRRRDGQIRWVRGGAVEVLDDQGKPTKMYGVVWDITKSKQAELALRQSEEHYRRMVELAALPISVTAFDGEVIYANKSALSFFGVEREDLPKLRAHDFWEDPIQRVDAASILAQAGELRGFEARYRVGKERKPRVALMTASVIEYTGRNVILGLHQDITDRKCAEEQLHSVQQQAEEQLHVVQHNAAKAVAACGRELALVRRAMASIEGEPPRILEAACRELVLAFELPLGIAGLLADNRIELRVMSEQLGPNQPSLVGTCLELGDDLVSGLFSEDPQPLWIEDASSDPLAASFRRLLVSDPTTPLVVLPVVVERHPAGLLLLGAGTGRALEAGSLNLAWEVTEQVARVLAASRQREACERLTKTLARIREIVVEGDGTRRDG